jgi:hypothetical protein
MTRTLFHKDTPSTTVTGRRYDDTFNTERTASATAAYTTSGRWLPTKGSCKRVPFTCLFIQMT